MKIYDVIVVGAGSAGCVLANRLSEDANLNVLVLEAGGEDRHRYLNMPLGFYRLFQDPKVGWNYASEPEPELGGRRIPLPRGKMLGGTSSINGMTYVRGNPADYDRWAQLGASGWSYAEVLPYFKRAEGSWRGETPYHGSSGPLSITRAPENSAFYQLVSGTARRFGWPVIDDIHAATDEGLTLVEFTIHRGRRGSTAARYLHPAMGRRNLAVERNAQVTRILLESGRATGVEYLKDGQQRTARAEHEIVLAAGAYNSPQLLMLSGIGPAEALRAQGVEPLHDLPGVGRNLVDHVAAGALFAANRPLTVHRELRFDRLAVSLLRWALFGTGPVSRMPVTCWAFYRTEPALARPDIQAMFNPVSPFAHVWFPLIHPGVGEVFLIGNCLLRPQSRGHLELRSANPLESPRIFNNFLSDSSDRETLRRALRITRTFAATAPLSGAVREELSPGASVETDVDLDAYIRKTAQSAFHPCGTCAMGSGSSAVVDPALRVRGIDGLRVADASVMPTITGGNLNATVIMIGEKASDLIRGRNPP